MQTLTPEQAKLPTHTSAALVHAHEAATAQLAAVLPGLTGLASRKPEAPVPADLLDLARTALRPAARIATALGAAPLLPLHDPITIGALAARCRLASAYLTRFREHYWRLIPVLDEWHWAVLPWIYDSADAADDYDDRYDPDHPEFGETYE